MKARRPLPRSPLTVAYGMGVDSTAMLVGFAARDMRPDLILFADTGAEKDATYAYLPIIQAWLASAGFPPVTVVRYVPTRAPYTSLEGECLANQTLPSLAFGMKSCSLKWKLDPQNRYKLTWEPALEAWARGEKVVTAVGLDNGKADTRRACKYWGTAVEDTRYETWHPLREWGWDRERCEAEIAGAGLPIPPKSSCYFCPAMHEEEIVQLAQTEPAKFEKAIAIEDGARLGKHRVGSGSVKGLGRRWTWRGFAEESGLSVPKPPRRLPIAAR